MEHPNDVTRRRTEWYWSWPYYSRDFLYV